MFPGCWDTNDDKQRQQCNTEVCEGVPSNKLHKFCCCNTDLCNENITMAAYDPTNAESIISSPTQPPEVKITLWEVPAFYVSFMMLGILMIFGIAYATCRHSPKPMAELAPLSPSGPGYSSNLYNVDNLNLVAMIGQGKYGSVWKGIVNEQPVAVKIFTATNKQYFYNERDIYTLPFMEHPALLTYFGCDERHTLDGGSEYLLVLSLAPLGCLQDYLIENTLSFAVFCKMAKSVARGLSHLHAEIKRDGLFKPCICHRDINSRNILVKPDLTCCIGDFGFATKTVGARYEYRGEMMLAETRSINEVGTVRYMAPEILEGAVNLRDCETSLKQIDVYSLGLVLWELCLRCHDWYPVEQSVPPYKAPYEDDIGPHPTFAQMQVLVAKRKARPLFPATWGGGAGAKLARETCEDCWDNDAEARLTSRCVEERFHEISQMKPRNIRALSPPTLSTNNKLAPTTPSFITTSPNARENVSVLAPLPQATDGFIKNRDMFATQIHPFQGANLCRERNLAPPNATPAQILIQHSKKHNDDGGMTEFESEVYTYEMNRNLQSLGEGIPKQQNSDRKVKAWSAGVKAIIEKKILTRQDSSSEDKSVLVDDSVRATIESSPAKNVIVNLRKDNAHVSSTIDTSNRYSQRPSNLDISPINIPGRDFSEVSFRSIASEGQRYAIVQGNSPRLVVSRSAGTMKSLATSSSSLNTVENTQLKRQRSLEIYNEVFAPSKDRLRDPSQRVKTPGDVPKSVREKRVRAGKTLSLYDDRMMNSHSQLL